MSPDLKSLADLKIDRGSGRDRRPRLGRYVAIGLAVVVALVGIVLASVWLAGRGATVVRAGTVRAVQGEGQGAVLNASGYVTARRRATVSAKMTGKVVEVLVEEGMAVSQGQLLARLDDQAARAALALGEAQLETARRSVAEVDARLRLAETTLARIRRLVEEGVLGQADLDAAEAEERALRARSEVLREQVAVAERELALRRIDLEDTRILAPFGGVAISKDAQPGEMISPVSAGGGFTRTGICTIVDMSSLEIEVDVNESYIHRVDSGRKVVATLDAYPDWRIPAQVLAIVPSADRQRATVKVRIAFDALDPRILPDMGVKVAFLAGGEPAGAPASRRLVVPKSAVRRQGDRDVVFVIAAGRVERRAVQVGPGGTDEVEIVAGLAEGEPVVVEGPADLSDGQRVRVSP